MTPEIRVDRVRAALRELGLEGKRRDRRVNPHLRIRLLRDGKIRVTAPRPGMGLCDCELGGDGDAEVYSWLTQPAVADPAHTLKESLLSRCEDLGLLIPVDQRLIQPVFSYAWATGQIAARMEESSTWRQQVSEAKECLRQRKCAVLRSVLPDDVLEHVQRYYRELVTSGFLPFGDKQSRRYYSHNEPVARWLHRETAGPVLATMPEACKPSYSYLGFYVGGAVLQKHRDREQCEYTLSLCIDAFPNSDAQHAWPLCVELPDGQTAVVKLGVGEGLLFKGRELPHYREPLPARQSSSSIFFHYVPAEFQGSVD